MAARGKDETQGFLSRWSQRKRTAEAATAEPTEAAPPEDSEAAGEQAVELAELPDIDTLDAGSDFTVFMRKGVPDALKQRALRRLWQVDPAFHHICMLDDYNLDYTDAATVVPNLKTLYQVGRGMVLPEEEAAEESQAEAAEEAAEAASPRQAAAIEETEAAPAVSEEGSAKPESRIARKPGTPLVPPSPTRGSSEAGNRPRAQAGAADGKVPSSARRRRWGDADS